MAATALMDDIDVAQEVERDRLENELYEIVDGQRIEKPPLSAYSGKVASRLMRWLGAFADGNKLGEAVCEVLFRLPLKEDSYRNRRADVAYVSFERWPADRPMPARENAWDVIPDLAVEVMSPHDFAEESLRKIHEYFQAGVRLVWAVYPEVRQVYVYDSLTQIRVLTADDTLDGGTVLPAFQLPLNRLFDPIPSQSAGD